MIYCDGDLCGQSILWLCKKCVRTAPPILSVWPYNNIFSYPRFRIYCFPKPHPFIWNWDHKRSNITSSKPPRLIHLGFDFWEFPFSKIWTGKKCFYLLILVQPTMALTLKLIFLVLQIWVLLLIFYFKNIAYFQSVLMFGIDISLIL